MCTLNAPVLHSGAVYYRFSRGGFIPGRRHVFELALFAECDEILGENNLICRLKLRFGKYNVGIRKNAAATTVIRIISDPLYRRCGKKYTATYIADVVRQHYGKSIPITIGVSRTSICLDRVQATRH
jgi:hypothetical protein